MEEKNQQYTQAPSGGPLVQHALLSLLEAADNGKITKTKIAQKMAHAVADCFQIEKRGYVREGYFADLVLVDLNKPTTVSKDNILYKCGWSPLEGFELAKESLFSGKGLQAIQILQELSK